MALYLWDPSYYISLVYFGWSKVSTTSTDISYLNSATFILCGLRVGCSGVYELILTQIRQFLWWLFVSHYGSIWLSDAFYNHSFLHSYRVNYLTSNFFCISSIKSDKVALSNSYLWKYALKALLKFSYFIK